jgi:hypothetical protein
MEERSPALTLHLKPKKSSALMRVLGFALEHTRIVPGFMDRFWTTIGSTVYTPALADAEDYGSREWFDRFGVTLAHEMQHALQAERYGRIGFMIMYFGPAPLYMIIALVYCLIGWDTWVHAFAFGIAMLPLSVGLAWGRWFLEREAYLINIAAASDREAEIERISQSLWRNYLAWPKKWSSAWFRSRGAFLLSKDADSSKPFDGSV